MTSAAGEPSKDKTLSSGCSEQDWSLRANGQTYRDRGNETSIIVNRLVNSSSSVTGIAGRRGAGKSSLVLRVLDQCRQKHYFTQLIHSPTSYEPREFLISVSRIICDEVIERLDERRGRLPSLDERAKLEERRISRLRNLLWAFAMVLFITVPTILIKQVNDVTAENAELRIENLTTEIRENRRPLAFHANRISDYLKKTISENDFRSVFDHSDLISVLGQLTDILSPPEEPLTGLRAAVWELDDLVWRPKRPNMPVPDHILLEIRYDLQPLLKLSESLRESQRARDVVSKYYTFGVYYNPMAAFITGTSLLILVVLSFVARHLGQRLRLLREVERKETGLRAEAVAFAEHLSYQQTLSTTQEAGVSIFQFSSALRKGKSLTTRTLSLPGLTEHCAEFLQKVGKVYSAGVVICFDELDKIDEPEELDLLLRGVKGMLGRDNTHFLFTVSDDAIGRFATRRTKEQGILESAFEDIVLLDRVDFRFADHVLSPMYGAGCRAEGSCKTATSTKLFWLFGGGIPREMKRSARVCLESELILKTADPFEIWRRLLKKRVEDIRLWVARIGGDDEATAEFLSALYRLEGQLMSQGHFDRRWIAAGVRSWIRGSTANEVTSSECGLRKEEERAEDEPSRKSTDLVYGRATIEVVLGITGGLVAEEYSRDEEFEKLAPHLSCIFEHAPGNFDFAWKTLHQYVGRMRLL